MPLRFPLVVALAAWLALPLVGCVVVDAPHGPPRYAGPPAHAPAHGYRRNHQGHDLVFDSELGVYLVVGRADLWFLDGSYFRIRGERWEVSASIGGPWRTTAAKAVPSRLYAKRHPHGAPPGQAKKIGRGK